MLYRNTGRKAFLVRPDHYVFGSVRTVEDLPALIDELAAALDTHGWRWKICSAMREGETDSQVAIEGA